MRVALAICVVALGLSGSSPSAAAVSDSTVHELDGSSATWSYRLDVGLAHRFPLLQRYWNPSVEGTSWSWRFLHGGWGMGSWRATPSYRVQLSPFAQAWLSSSSPPLAPLPSWEPSELAWIPGLADGRPKGPDPWFSFPSRPRDLEPHLFWSGAPRVAGVISPQSSPVLVSSACLEKPVSFVRYGSETDKFSLLTCDGTVAPEALDRLSVMARPPGVPRPDLPLPDQPDVGAENGEWISSIKLVHPRLVWLVQRVSDSFPGRSLYIVSGYRTGNHAGKHGVARGLDMTVMGVANERLYRFCRKLRDVGCGYYPNHNFVHLDVRAAGQGGAYWVDISEPGARSEYVDSWPGVEAGGAAVWK